MNIDARILKNDLAKLDPALVNTVLAGVVAWAAGKTSSLARQKAPKFTSTLAQSIKPNRLNDLLWEVNAGQRYAAGLEFGGGHQGEALTYQRLYALEQWVKGKNIESDPVRIAYAAWHIGKHIQAQGVKEQPFMRPALEEIEPQVLPRLKREIESKL
jgi:hypothetical protein